MCYKSFVDKWEQDKALDQLNMKLCSSFERNWMCQSISRRYSRRCGSASGKLRLQLVQQITIYKMLDEI